MKKITKRIMALMLSLVMILGCVPSFINEASANEINTVADVLATVDFPISTNSYAPNNAWVSSQGYTSYLYNGFICFDHEWAELIYTSYSVTKEENNYIDKSNNITFVMTDEKLTSIIYNGITYEPAPITIADILDTVEGRFPTTLDKAWQTEDGNKVFFSDSKLSFYSSNNPYEAEVKLNFDTKVTEKDNGYNFVDGLTTISFNMANGELKSITYSVFKGDLKGTYEPAVKTITVNYEQPKTLEELVVLNGNANAITVNANASSISNFTKKNIEGSPLYLVADKNPEFLGYFVILTPITFEDDVHCNAVDRVYLRDIDLGKPTKSLNDVLLIASTIDYVVAKEANSILVIEKFDFSKKLNITASLNANMKVIDAINSIKDNITDDGIVRNYSIKEDPDGDPLDDDATLEAGKKYYLNGIIKNVVDSICYNQVSINNKVLPYDSPANPEKPISFSYTKFSNNSEDCGFEINYEFTAASNSSGSSKKYKTNNTSGSAEKVSGSGKKGSTRTITPIEGKKVSSVIVKDKDGNKVDVTLNEDGTYSFKQPASDVTIEVNYKNREITLNIGSTEAEVDGEKSNLDVCPVVRNDRTMLPIRYVAENLGAKVEWNEKKPNYVAITRGDTKIEITLGSDIMLVNGKEVKLDSVAFAENDRTYLPVRAISEALNAIVEWNEEKPNEVKIYER